MKCDILTPFKTYEEAERATGIFHPYVDIIKCEKCGHYHIVCKGQKN